MSSATATPLRLLLLTDELEIGGTQRHIVRLASALDRRRFEPQVSYFSNPAAALLAELRAADVPVTRIAKRPGFDPGFVLRFTQFLRRERFDLVHAFALAAEFWGALAHRIAGRRAGRFLSSVRGRYEWYSPLQWRAKACASAHSACVVANSRAGAEYAIRCRGVRRDQLRIVPNGLGADAFRTPPRAQARAQLGLGEADYVLAFIGRLVEVKNLGCLLRAIAQLDGVARSGLRLLVAGDGPLRAAHEAEARTLHIETQIRWLGERRDVPAVLAAADLAVQPSRNEGMSNAIMEAMAAGLPVVATAVGGNPELVVEGVTGRLVGDDDAAALAHAIAALAADRDRGRAMGAAARERARREYSLETMVSSMSRIYGEVASGGPIGYA